MTDHPIDPRHQRQQLFPTLHRHRGYFLVLVGEVLFHCVAATDHLFFASRHLGVEWKFIGQFPGGGYQFFGTCHLLVGATLLCGLILEGGEGDDKMRLTHAALISSMAIWIWYLGCFIQSFANGGTFWLVGPPLMGLALSLAAFLEPPHNPATDGTHEHNRRHDDPKPEPGPLPTGVVPLDPTDRVRLRSAMSRASL